MNRCCRTAILIAGTSLLFHAGCKKPVDNLTKYRRGIDRYYAAHPACVWTDPKKFPVQVTTSDTDKTTQYDALVDQALLTRTTEEKKVFIIGSKQVTNYDLSDKGRGAWTADASQPGFGNFCYGHRTVQSIDSASPDNGQPGAIVQISYRYGIADAPIWAQLPETQTAFPQIKADLSGNGVVSATLIHTNDGWQLQAPQPAARPATSADGKIVE